MSPTAIEPGRVYLVGAGPGDPGLITRRGAECLARADLVLVDYLVNPALLDHAPPTAERVSLGHHSRGREIPPEEVVARMIDAARRGRTVVRLKGGDPSIFARESDEVTALRAAGLPLEIVPGVTSGLAAADCTGFGAGARAVALVTGRQRTGKEPGGLDYTGLAAFPGTLLFYMGVRSAAQWSGDLLARGGPPETPVVVVRRCTWPDQQTVRCTLGEVGDVIRSQRLRPPAIVLVGDKGKPPAQPAAAVLDPGEPLEGYEWVVLGSPDDAARVLARLACQGGDVRRLAGVKLAAVGAEAAQYLAQGRIRADLVVSESTGSAIEPLVHACRGRRVFLAAAAASAALASALTEAAERVDERG